MASKDFKVKNGLVVGGSGLFDSDVDILGQLKINGTIVINNNGTLVTQYSGFDSDFAARLASSNTDSIQEGLNNLYYTSVRVNSDITNLVDSTYVQGKVPEAYITGFIDSAYVQARSGAGVDSAAITLLIDSAYVQARQIIGGAGGSVDSAQTIALITDTVDAAYVQARQIIGEGGGSSLGGNRISQIYFYYSDSNQSVFSDSDARGRILSYVPENMSVFINGIMIVDSADYVAIDGTSVTLNTGVPLDTELTIVAYPTSFDSAETISLITSVIDSSYEIYVTDIVTDIVDSAYIQARQIPVAGSRISQIYFYYSDSNQSVFSDSDARGRILSYVPGNMSAFLNGIMMVDSADYVATDGSSLVLNSGAPLDAELTIVAYPTSFDSAQTAGIIRSQIVPFNLTNSKSTSIYYYTADNNQTTFTGADDNGSTLSYVPGGLQAYLNGILLVNNIDYTATDGTSIVLDLGANSGDNLTFISNKDLAGIVYHISDTSYFDYKFIADSGQISFSGNDANGNLLAFDSDKFSIFINGIRIQPDIDYTANSATNVVDLTYPSDSADEILISTLISGGDNGPYIIIDSDYVQARQTDPVSKAIAISMVFGN